MPPDPYFSRRFLNEDPSGFSGGGNLYAYSGGDPVDLMDPFGLGPVNDNGASAIDSYQTAASQQLEQSAYAAQNPQYAAVVDEANASYMATVPQDGAEQAVRGLAAVSEGLGVLALAAVQPEDLLGAEALGPIAEEIAPAAADPAFIDIEALDFSTAPNKAVFYSGPGNRARALSFAGRTGATPIDFTPGGRYLS